MGKGIFCIPGVTMYARFDILAISKYDNARVFFFKIIPLRTISALEIMSFLFLVFSTNILDTS